MWNDLGHHLHYPSPIFYKWTKTKENEWFIQFPIWLRPESRSSNSQPRVSPYLHLTASPVRIGRGDPPEEQENANPPDICILPFISKCEFFFFFRSLSWQLLDVFQRREILKPKKEINASKLPAGSPERCLIQEAGAEGALWNSAKLSQADVHEKETGFLSFLIKSSQPLAIAPGVTQLRPGSWHLRSWSSCCEVLCCPLLCLYLLSSFLPLCSRCWGWW